MNPSPCTSVDLCGPLHHTLYTSTMSKSRKAKPTVSLGKRKADMTPEQLERVARNKRLAEERKTKGGAAPKPGARGKDPYYKVNELPAYGEDAYLTFTEEDGEITCDQMYNSNNGPQLSRDEDANNVYANFVGKIYVLKDDGRTRSIYRDGKKVGEKKVYKLKLELVDRKGNPASLDVLKANEAAVQKAFYDRRDKLVDDYAVKSMYQTVAANAERDGVDPNDFLAAKNAPSNIKWRKKDFDGKKKFVDAQGNIISKSELQEKGVPVGVANFPSRIKSKVDAERKKKEHIEIDLLQDQVTAVKDYSQKDPNTNKRIVKNISLEELCVGDRIKIRLGVAAYCNAQGVGFTYKGPYGKPAVIEVFKSDKMKPVNIHGDEKTTGGNDTAYLAFLDAEDAEDDAEDA